MTERLIAIVSYTIAIALIGLWIYFLPMTFIGFAVGLGIGLNWNKIESWIDGSDDPFESL